MCRGVSVLQPALQLLPYSVMVTCQVIVKSHSHTHTIPAPSSTEHLHQAPMWLLIAFYDKWSLSFETQNVLRVIHFFSNMFMWNLFTVCCMFLILYSRIHIKILVWKPNHLWDCDCICVFPSGRSGVLMGSSSSILWWLSGARISWG